LRSCFHDAERILSAIAKSLFTSLEKKRGGIKWERGDVGEGSVEGRDGYRWADNGGNAQK